MHIASLGKGPPSAEQQGFFLAPNGITIYIYYLLVAPHGSLISACGDKKDERTRGSLGEIERRTAGHRRARAAMLSIFCKLGEVERRSSHKLRSVRSNASCERERQLGSLRLFSTYFGN